MPFAFLQDKLGLTVKLTEVRVHEIFNFVARFACKSGHLCSNCFFPFLFGYTVLEHDYVLVVWVKNSLTRLKAAISCVVCGCCTTVLLYAVFRGSLKLIKVDARTVADAQVVKFRELSLSTANFKLATAIAKVF